jgi:hypothetical protein
VIRVPTEKSAELRVVLLVEALKRGPPDITYCTILYTENASGNTYEIWLKCSSAQSLLGIIEEMLDKGHIPTTIISPCGYTLKMTSKRLDTISIEYLEKQLMCDIQLEESEIVIECPSLERCIKVISKLRVQHVKIRRKVCSFEATIRIAGSEPYTTFFDEGVRVLRPVRIPP